MILTSSRSIEAGTAMVHAAGASLQDLTEAIRASAGRMHAIGGQSRAQSLDGGRVVDAMANLTTIAESNAAATLRETNRTVADLSRLAVDLGRLVSRFRIQGKPE